MSDCSLCSTLIGEHSCREVIGAKKKSNTAGAPYKDGINCVESVREEGVGMRNSICKHKLEHDSLKPSLNPARRSKRYMANSFPRRPVAHDAATFYLFLFCYFLLNLSLQRERTPT